MGQRLADVRWNTFVIPQPAAGAELVFVNDANVARLIISLAFDFTTSAVVANRAPSLKASSPDGVFYTCVAGVVQAASVTVEYGAFVGGTRNGSAGGNVCIGLPGFGLPLFPGWTLLTGTDNLDVGDQFTAARVLALEYETGPIYAGVPIPPFYVPEYDPSYAG